MTHKMYQVGCRVCGTTYGQWSADAPLLCHTCSMRDIEVVEVPQPVRTKDEKLRILLGLAPGAPIPDNRSERLIELLGDIYKVLAWHDEWQEADAVSSMRAELILEQKG